MPRGKYVNHKGRQRQFTMPEELEQQLHEEDSNSESSNNGGFDDIPGTSKTSAKQTGKYVSETESEDESEEDDRDAKKGVSSLIQINNPNRQIKKISMKVENINLDAKTSLSGSERKRLDKAEKYRKYMKLHAEGKTPQAMADLARLALIRQQREEAAAKREAEKKVTDEKKNINMEDKASASQSSKSRATSSSTCENKLF